MTIAERIISIIDNKGLNMSEAGRMLNVTPAYISKLKQKPESVPSDRFVIDFCNKFGVNERWLRTGEGEMFRPKTKAQEIADITEVLINAEEHPDQNLRARAVLYKAIHSLTDAQIQAVMDFAEQLYKEMNEK